MLTVSSHCA